MQASVFASKIHLKVYLINFADFQLHSLIWYHQLAHQNFILLTQIVIILYYTDYLAYITHKLPYYIWHSFHSDL